MKKSTKATLLSALIFPGAGHLSLRKYWLGFGLVGVAVISLSILMSDAIGKAKLISEKILNGEIQADLVSIMEAVAKQQTGVDAQHIKIATGVLIIVWVIGIIDSYRVGCLQDN